MINLFSPSIRLSSLFRGNRNKFYFVRFCWQAFKKTVGLLLILITVSAVDVYAQQMFPMEDFIGVNIRREDPIEYLDCAGFVREYHDWVIDEGDIYQNSAGGNASENYPNNKYKFTEAYQGQSNVNFDEFYTNILSSLDPATQNNNDLPLCANMKYCLPRLAGDPNHNPEKWPIFAEFKPVESAFTIYSPSLSGTHPCLDPSNSACELTANGDIEYIDVNADTESPKSYRHFADWVRQFYLRYGEEDPCQDNTNKDCKLLKVSDEQTGQNLVGYIEIWNEQDKFWFDHAFEKQDPNNSNNTISAKNMVKFSPAEYAAMASAAFDGNCGEFKGENPSSGLPDPTYNLGTNRMQYVFGGLSDFDWDYVEGVYDWCVQNRTCEGKKFPFDVINFHHYSDNKWDGISQIGVSPEEDNWNNMTFKQMLQQTRTLTDNLEAQVKILHNNPDATLELWMSEFGYDTNDNSPQRVPVIEANDIVSDQQEVQGQWMVRSYLEMAAAGWDRAMMFCIRDNNSNPNGTLFQSSGLLKDKASGYAPKKSYFYVYTMKEVLKGTRFVSEETDAGFENNSTDANHPRIYRFMGQAPHPETGIPTDKEVYTVWMPTAANNSNANYKLYLNGATSPNFATLVQMQSGDTNGFHQALTTQSDVNGDYVEIPISERPVYVILGQVWQRNDPVLTCPTDVNAKGISCDAVHLSWNDGGIDQEGFYRIYYYEKSDSEENGAPEFNLQDAKWKIYTDNLSGDCNEVVVAGLKKLNDNYYFYIEVVDAVGNLSDGCIYAGRTALCADNYIEPEVFLGANPDFSSNFNSLFDYDRISWCYPQSEPLIPDVNGNESSSISFPSYDEIITFNEPYRIQAISLYDMNGSDTYRIEYATPAEPNNFKEFLNYEAALYLQWQYLPSSVCEPITKMRFIHEGSDYVGKIVMHGQPTSNIDGMYEDAKCCGDEDSRYIGEAPSNPDEEISQSITLLSGEFGNGINSSDGEEIVVNGTLVIDKDFTFTNTTFKMAPGAKIEVGKETLNATVTLDNCTLEGCDRMWRGIQIMREGTFTIRNSSIRDAFEAIYKTNTETQLTFPALIIENTVFQSNYTGIHVKGALFVNNSTVIGCTFDGGEGDLKPLYPDSPSNVFTYPCFSEQKSIYGIRVQDTELTSFWEIGEEGANVNVFSRLREGIRSRNTNLKVVNTKFENMTELSSYGIRFYGGHLIQEGLGSGIDTGFAPLSFNNVYRALYLYQCRYDVSQNRIFNNNPGFGIQVLFNSKTFSTSTIDDNYIDIKETCISITAQDEHKVLVTDNELKTRSFGIIVNGYLNTNPQLEIKGNKIQAGPSEAARGIFLLSTKGTDVIDNEINLNTWSQQLSYGIQVADSENILLDKNIITGNSDFLNLYGSWETASANLYGIYAVNSPSCTFQCNELDYTKAGILIEENCTTPKRFMGNKFGIHGAGLWLRNGGILGVQNHRGNKWKTENDQVVSQQGVNYPGGAARHWQDFTTIEDFDLELIQIRVNSSETGHHPDMAVIPTSAIDKWFVPENANDFSCVQKINKDPYTRRSEFRQNVLSSNGIYTVLAGNNSIGYGLSAAVQWNLNRHIYAVIQEEYPNGAPDSRLSNFVNTHNATSLGQFYQVEQDIQQLMAMDLNSRLTQIQVVRAANTGISAIAPYEQYEQTVNDIFLQTLAVENLDFSETQKNTLLNIASLCSYEAGAAVFKARSLYRLIDQSMQFSNVCNANNGSAKREQIENSTVINEYIHLYPNPANHLLHVETNLQGTIRIIDILGKEVYRTDIVEATTEINTHSLSDGVYFISLKTTEGMIITEKLIVNH